MIYKKIYSDSSLCGRPTEVLEPEVPKDFKGKEPMEPTHYFSSTSQEMHLHVQNLVLIPDVRALSSSQFFIISWRVSLTQALTAWKEEAVTRPSCNENPLCWFLKLVLFHSFLTCKLCALFFFNMSLFVFT